MNIKPLCEQARMELAHQIANIAVRLDYPGTVHLAEQTHSIAMELAGERVDEVYAPDDEPTPEQEAAYARYREVLERARK